MRIDKDGRQRLNGGETLPRCELCNGAPCEWDKYTVEWICHRHDDLLTCHSQKKEGGVGWYCTLDKEHKGDHECWILGKLIRRWKQ